MNRRRFLTASATALGSLTLPTESPAASTYQTPAPAKRPNILLLMSDQHRPSCLGVAGDTLAHTPNLDHLASQSVRFTSAYCTNPVCAPSRATLMTGRWTHHLETPGHAGTYPLRQPTIAHHFSQAGYLTALIGKMHFGDAQTHGFDYELEFNDWFQTLGPHAATYAAEVSGSGAGSNSGSGLPQIESLWRGRGNPWKNAFPSDHRLGGVAVGRPSLLDEPDHFDSFVARESIRFLENYAAHTEPFFLVTSFLKPHEPFMPATRFADMYHPTEMQLPPTWGKAQLDHLPREVRHNIEACPFTPELLSPDACRQRIASYYGNLAQMDDCAGQVLTALTRLGLDSNTIVLYISDHGEMLGDLGLWGKFQFYENSCGVPLFIRQPGVAPGLRHHPVSLISIVPTLADLAGVSITTPVDGASIAPILHEPATPPSPIFAEYSVNNRNAKFLIRDGRYKFTLWTHDVPELYDLESDPHELHNLASDPDRQPLIAQLKTQLLAWHTPAGL